MKAINFKKANVVYGANQPEYIPLPAFRDIDGNVVTCWELTPEEITQIKETGKLYVHQMTFNNPYHPIRLETDIDKIFENE